METGPYANPAQAVLALRLALARDPGNRTFRLGLMELYRQQGRLEEARALAEAYLAEGSDRELRQELRLIYAETGATEPLLELLREGEDACEATLVAGLHATSCGQWETALALLGRSLALAPEAWDTWLTYCNVLMHAHRLPETVARVSELLGLETLRDARQRARLGFLKGAALLLQGRLEEGLPWLECRFAMEDGPVPETLPMEVWTGEDLAGRTLLVQAEQGYGDVFMLARYIAVLAARGAKVLLRPQTGTQGVLATCDGLAGLAEGDLVLPGHTLRVPILSLPRLCGTSLASVPARIPYLRVPDKIPDREAIDACLAQAGARRRIGLVWAGNPEHHRDGDRSMPPEFLDLLADVPDVAWVDLQIAPGPRPALPMLGLSRHLPDFSATAYALAHLDGLITVDSSPAHLAGALGRPVWLALAWLPDWRWMLERRDSPWYPTMELWRQPSPGDWGAVVRAMRARLLSGPW
jgi:hypothetical protein